MVVENAERFGLSQLHQLRGRVGRGVQKSYCVLFSEGKGDATRERLNIMTQTNDGFIVAQKDLELRGPGDFFGTRQHGLPTLRVASLSGDMRVLNHAQEEAKSILAADPALLQYPALKENEKTIKRMFKDGVKTKLKQNCKGGQ
jgi:ATP-dependent DNA helicase RecG